MYELNYVRRRRRKIFAAVIGGLASVGLSVFILTSFLGRYVGTFTVSLSNQDVSLTLNEKKDFNKDTNTTFLHISEIAPFEEYTYSSLPTDGELDNEEADYLYGANMNPTTNKASSLNYFKYTFYVKNVGTVACNYNLQVKILENKKSDDGRYLDDTLRVMLYENEGDSEEHQSKIYAKRGAIPHLDEDGNPSFKEAISVPEDKSTSLNPFVGYAEEFESGDVITTLRTEGFQMNDYKRYTLVSWLEGYDPQSNNLFEAPKGASIKLGVEINAYEN